MWLRGREWAKSRWNSARVTTATRSCCVHDFIVIQLLNKTDGNQYSKFCLWRNLNIYIYIYYYECAESCMIYAQCRDVYHWGILFHWEIWRHNLSYDYKRYLPITVENTFFLSPTNIDEILNEVQKLNPKTSCGPDNIRAKVIKLFPKIFAENLSIIYNKAIEIGLKSSKKLLLCLKKVTSTNLTTIVPLVCYLASTKYLKNYFVND